MNHLPPGTNRLFLRPSRPAAALSILELLVVIAIVTVLAGLAIPAFNSIGQAKGSSQAAHQLAAAVELARAEAIARNTFVWLGIQSEVQAGNSALRVALVASDRPTASAQDLRPLVRPFLLHNVTLSAPEDLDVGTDLSGVMDVRNNAESLSFDLGSGRTFATTVTFTPSGEALLKGLPSGSDGFVPEIAIGCRQTRGTTPVPGADNIVLIDGSTARSSILRK